MQANYSTMSLLELHERDSELLDRAQDTMATIEARQAAGAERLDLAKVINEREERGETVPQLKQTVEQAGLDAAGLASIEWAEHLAAAEAKIAELEQDASEDRHEKLQKAREELQTLKDSHPGFAAERQAKAISAKAQSLYEQSATMLNAGDPGVRARGEELQRQADQKQQEALVLQQGKVNIDAA